MAKSREEDYYDILGGIISDKLTTRLIVDSLVSYETENENAPTRGKSSGEALLQNISRNKNKIDAASIPTIREED